MATSELLKQYQELRREKRLPDLLKRESFRVNASSCGVLEEPVIRIMQWNMLAQALSQGGDNFILCPPEALVWENRKLHVMEEILTYDPMIICLQEVDYYKFLETELKKAGYEGYFKEKTFSPCLDIQPNNGPDGCAIFWKKSALDVINNEGLVIKDSAGYPTNQICILSHLRLKQHDAREIFMAITHLKAKTGYKQLRYDQSQFLNKVLQEKCGNNPVIICGDLNADPNEKAYKELMTSDLGLSSAYTFLNDTGEEPPFTTMKVRGSPLGATSVCKAIDYIMFSKNKLAVTSLIKFPSKEELGEKMLPSFNYPSDHLSLICDFNFIK